MASGLIEVTTPRPTDAWGRRGVDRPDGPSTFESFVESGWPALQGLALAVATLHPDELFAQRLRSAINARAVSSVRWLSTMGEIEISDTFTHREPLGDGENVAVSWRWPGEQAATAVVYVDHNQGTIVSDAFIVPRDAGVLAAINAKHADRYIVTAPIAPADARSRIAEAIEKGELTIPPTSTDTWPTCRPMLEWVLRRLPEGGIGYVRPEWAAADRDGLLDDFTASMFGQVTGLSRSQVQDLADPLVWFGCDYGPGDPLRWSPVSVEIVLADWYPRKVFGAANRELRRLPDVLAGFVRYCHARVGVPADLTADTLASVERWRAAFLAAIVRPGRSPFDNATRLARIAAGFDDGDGDGDDDDLIGDDEDHERDMAAIVAAARDARDRFGRRPRRVRRARRPASR